MHIFLKAYYFALFISLDVLLYLRLGRGILKVELALKIIAGLLVATFILHLPFVNIPYLTKFKNFATMCAMVIQLLIVYFIGMFAKRRMERRPLPDEVKEYALSWLNIVFNHVIFFFFMFGHLLWTLALR